MMNVKMWKKLLMMISLVCISEYLTFHSNITVYLIAIEKSEKMRKRKRTESNSSSSSSSSSSTSGSDSNKPDTPKTETRK